MGVCHLANLDICLSSDFCLASVTTCGEGRQQLGTGWRAPKQILFFTITRALISATETIFRPHPQICHKTIFRLHPHICHKSKFSLAPIFATSTLFHSKAKLATLNMFWQYSLPMLVGLTSFPAIMSSLSVTTMCKPLPICSAFFWTHVNNSKTNGSVQLFLGKVRKRKRRYPIRFLFRSVQCFETGLRGVRFLPRFCCAKSYVDPLIAGKRSICTYHPAFRPLPHSCWAFVGKH